MSRVSRAIKAQEKRKWDRKNGHDIMRDTRASCDRPTAYTVRWHDSTGRAMVVLKAVGRSVIWFKGRADGVLKRIDRIKSVKWRSTNRPSMPKTDYRIGRTDPTVYNGPIWPSRDQRIDW